MQNGYQVLTNSVTRALAILFTIGESRASTEVDKVVIIAIQVSKSQHAELEIDLRC